MSISKIRVKSAVARHNNDSATTNCSNHATSTFSPKTTESTKSFKKDSPKVFQKQKSKILPLSTTNATGGGGGGAPPPPTAKLSNNKIPNEAAIVAGTAGGTAYNTGIPPTTPVTATTTTTLPQSTLLKIEPFVPSLASRLQKPIRRSYSTLSTTALKKRLHNVNTNLAVNLEIANNSKKTTMVQGTNLEATLGTISKTNTCSSTSTSNSNTNANTNTAALAKVPKQTAQTLRRRQPLRGAINRQRSKSTSSSNSASNRPATSLVTAVTATATHTPTLGTPCSPPQNALVIPQPNGICRIQRNAKEQEKLPDRINYDKRGLTAIPIFEKETNLRLLSLQHNLINTFHIPKEEKLDTTKLEVETVDNPVATAVARPTDLHITNSSNLTYNPAMGQINRPRFPLTLASPNADYPASQSQFTLPNNVTLPNHHVSGGFGSYMLQRNKLLHRSINLNNVTLQQNGLVHTGPPLRFGMRKSKSFVNNFNLQFQISRRGLQNQRANFLKKAEISVNLKSLDSSTTSTLTTDSCSTTAPTPDIEEEDELKVAELEIKNRQLLVNYGTIFQNLVFLDLYDNQIERISNLDGLTALTVLLLGKNRITDIAGLASLKSTLRVLDLHGNKLCSIANKINCLKELKSLNLAGNQIRQINHMDFLGLCSLKELNLKRNKLKRVNGFQHLASLERLWLCHNDLHKVDDMSTIAQASNLIEVTIENNPVSLAGDCVSFLVSYLPKLQTLSQMPITEQVRKAAMTWRTNKELSDQSSQLGNKEQFNLIRREEIISNARTNWELLRSQQMLQQCNDIGSSSSSGSVSNSSTCSTSNCSSSSSSKKVSKSGKLNVELEKITEANEQSYEEFIKLPPIVDAKQDQSNKDKEERTSSASSLGPNVNSSSSCYSSGDDDELDRKSKNITEKTSNSSATTSSNVNHLSNLKTNQNEPQSSNNDGGSMVVGHANSQHLMGIKNEQDIATTTATASASVSLPGCPPTLTIQFPSESINSKLSNYISQSQNQTPNQTTLINGTTTVQASSTTLTSATASSSSPSPSPCSATGPLCKRYMTGTLIRSQTIVGPGGSNGYAIKATTTTTTTAANSTYTVGIGSNNIQRYHGARLSSANATTQQPTTAALAAHQQTATGIGTATTTTMPLGMGTGTIDGPPATSLPNHILSIAATVNAPQHMSNGFGGCLTTLNTTKMMPVNNAAVPGASASKLAAIEREREQGGDYLIEICGRYLNIYGQGALRFIDKQWNPTKANDVHTLNFSYINFNNITAILARIKVRFPHAENFVFRETNINSLGQLNALAELQGIASLFIDPEGNSLTTKDLWRQYAIYRLSHWGLKTLNNMDVTPQEVDKANLMYAGLSELILWSMPDAMLQPLLTRLRLDESCTASKMLPKQWLQKPDNRSLRLVVGKEALQWKKCHQQETLHGLPTPQQIRQLQAQFYAGVSGDVNQMVLSSASALASPTTSSSSATASSITSLSAAAVAAMAATAASSSSSATSLTQRERGKIHFTIMMENTCNAVEKIHKLEQIWSTMLLNIVRNTLLDYTQLDVYIRDLMGDIMK